MTFTVRDLPGKSFNFGFGWGICEWCGKPFKKKKSYQRFCIQEHQQRAKDQRKCERLRQLKQK